MVSIVTVVTAAASVSMAAAHDVRFPEVSVAVPVAAAASLWAFAALGSSPVAVLVVVMVVALLLALDAHVGDDHLGAAVPHGHAVPGIVPATVGRQVLPGSVDKKSTVGENRSVRERVGKVGVFVGVVSGVRVCA